jgi:hypothetical protein
MVPNLSLGPLFFFCDFSTKLLLALIVAWWGARGGVETMNSNLSFGFFFLVFSFYDSCTESSSTRGE